MINSSAYPESGFQAMLHTLVTSDSASLLAGVRAKKAIEFDEDEVAWNEVMTLSTWLVKNTERDLLKSSAVDVLPDDEACHIPHNCWPTLVESPLLEGLDELHTRLRVMQADLRLAANAIANPDAALSPTLASGIYDRLLMLRKLLEHCKGH